MPLEEYRRKRNFQRTPEPTGDAKNAPAVKRGGKRLFFCVQKHLASHLHYDLRLEHQGVLLSWAVPKGPSLDPADKRMAVHVEDHPLAYGDFEGVIPEGYGTGIVMLWDYGTWQPETDDVDEALRKGDLKFSLDGYKLKGSWVLVRLRDRGDTPARQRGRNWLLIKHRDHWSGPLDITEFAPASVKSGGDFDDILTEDMPATWVSDKPATGGATSRLLRDVITRAAQKILDREAAAKRAARIRGRKASDRTPKTLKANTQQRSKKPTRSGSR